MNVDEFEVLIVQFSEYISRKFSASDWEMTAMEFGVLDAAQNTKRFFRSYEWADEDMARRTTHFLKKVRSEDESLARNIMIRAYEKTEGANAETLKEYPALQALEDGNGEKQVPLPHLPVNSEQFISIESVSGPFYSDLIDNINQSYRMGIYDGTLVLSRKLIENLLADIFRKKYGDKQIDLYYNPNRKELHGFYELKENFSTNLSDFEPYSDEIGSDFIHDLDSIRRTANKEAHSIESQLTDENMQKHSDQVEYIAKVLSRLYKNI